MKLKTLLLTLSLLFFGINTPTLADFNDGWVAYEKGDYKTAVSEWRSSAEQGDVDTPKGGVRGVIPSKQSY
jgi:hypothetical protein